MKTTLNFLILSFSIIFWGCAQDDFNSYLSNTDSISLYKEKLKELAKQYDIEVTLNEDSFIKNYDNISISNMESLCAQISKMQCYYHTDNSSPKSFHKGIRKKISLSENYFQDPGQVSGEFDIIYIENGFQTELGSISITITWNNLRDIRGRYFVKIDEKGLPPFYGQGSIDLSSNYSNNALHVSGVFYVPVQYLDMNLYIQASISEGFTVMTLTNTRTGHTESITL